MVGCKPRPKSSRADISASVAFEEREPENMFTLDSSLTINHINHNIDMGVIGFSTHPMSLDATLKGNTSKASSSIIDGFSNEFDELSHALYIWMKENFCFTLHGD